MTFSRSRGATMCPADPVTATAVYVEVAMRIRAVAIIAAFLAPFDVDLRSCRPRLAEPADHNGGALRARRRAR